MTDWDSQWLDMAFYVANKFSKDPTTKVGAVVEGETHNLIAFGWNGFPPKIADDERLHDRALKNEIVVHAEVNALNNASFKPKTLYSTHFPCVRCTVDILSRRSVEKVVTVIPEGEYAERWRDSTRRSMELFKEAGVSVKLARVTFDCGVPLIEWV